MVWKQTTSIQIFTAHEGNGAKYLPKVTEDRAFYFPETEGRGKIVGPRSSVTEGRHFAPFHEFRAVNICFYNT